MPKRLCLKYSKHKANTSKKNYILKFERHGSLHPVILDLCQTELVLKNNLYAFKVRDFFIHSRGFFDMRYTFFRQGISLSSIQLLDRCLLYFGIINLLL